MPGIETQEVKKSIEIKSEIIKKVFMFIRIPVHS